MARIFSGLHFPDCNFCFQKAKFTTLAVQTEIGIKCNDGFGVADIE